jgi:hypothetical protein
LAGSVAGRVKPTKTSYSRLGMLPLLSPMRTTRATMGARERPPRRIGGRQLMRAANRLSVELRILSPSEASRWPNLARHDVLLCKRGYHAGERCRAWSSYRPDRSIFRRSRELSAWLASGTQRNASAKTDIGAMIRPCRWACAPSLHSRFCADGILKHVDRFLPLSSYRQVPDCDGRTAAYMS